MRSTMTSDRRYSTDGKREHAGLILKRSSAVAEILRDANILEIRIRVDQGHWK